MANLKISELDAGTTPLAGDELVAIVQGGVTVRVPSSALKGLKGDPGDPGDPGADGREVELQKGTTHIQWRYVGDPTWIDLVSLDDITGPPGSGGATTWDDITGKPSTFPPGGGAGGVLAGSFPNPDFAVDMATQGELDALASSTTAALGDKVDKVTGKGLSTEDYSSAEKTKLAGIATGATANSADATLLARANHTGTQAIPTVTGLQTALDAKIESSEKGAVNGVATLGSDQKIPADQLPAIAITDAFPVASQAAMLALTAEKGDIAIRSDLNKSFVLSTNSPSTLADWLELKTPTDAVLSVAGRTGAVTLTKTDVGLANVDNTADSAKPVSTAQQTALDAKEGTITAGTTAQYWRGDKSWRDFATDVRAAVLTGLSTASSAAVTATNTVLEAIGLLQAQVNTKQATLVSSTNIKTINGNSLLGSGDLTISGSSAGDHAVVVHTGAGYGSTNTAVRRYSTTLTNIGTAITYATSSANGASFTINDTAIYEIYAADTGSSSGYLGISLNSVNLDFPPDSLPIANRLAMTWIGSATRVGTVTRVVRLTAGDVIRVQCNSGIDITSNFAFFSIRKVGT